MRSSLPLLLAACGSPVQSEPSPTLDPFERCDAPAPVLGEACVRGFDCMVICDCSDAEPVAAGNCAGNLCEGSDVACTGACEAFASTFAGRTCAVGDTGLWPADFR